MDSVETENQTADYDAVSALYDQAFRDIRVRRDEWRWIETRMRNLHRADRQLRVLDVGCGNGALMLALQRYMARGVGVDVSTRTIALATDNARASTQLSFQAIRDASLPFADQSFDVVISFLSFRYLDWQRSLREFVRVLSPNGRILIVDMARQPIAPSELPLLARTGMQHVLRPLRDRHFHRDVAQLTSHPDWHRMLQRNPMRSGADYRACLETAFPGGRVETLNATLSKRVIAFDSGPVRV